MPKYKCVNVGLDGYPVWLMLNDRATIAAIEPNTYHETGSYATPEQVLLMTVVTLVVDGCCVEVKTPATVDSVIRILGFVWDEKDMVGESAPPEAAEDDKAGGGVLP